MSGTVEQLIRDEGRLVDPLEQAELQRVAVENDEARRAKLAAVLEHHANDLKQLGQSKIGHTLVAALQTEVDAHTRALLRVNPSNPHDVVRLQSMIGVYQHVINLIPLGEM